MNRFVTNLDPVIAAQDQCDKPLRKMITEEGQMLSSVIRHFGVMDDDRLMGMPVNHLKHDCYEWLLQGYANFSWAMRHWDGLAAEYQYRFDKVHGTETRLTDVFGACKAVEFHHLWGELQDHTPHPQCFGKRWPHKTHEDWPVNAYRSYLRDYKPTQMEMEWTRRQPPAWFTRRHTHAQTSN